MNLELTNKVVVITGGTGGIGSQIVADFLEEGATVVCLIRNKNKMDEFQNSLKKQAVSTKQLYSYECDLLDFDAIKSVIQKITNELKRIDVLINCAGFAHEFPFALLDKKQIDSMVNLNFTSPLYLCHAVLRTMFKQNEGCIINVSSISSIKKGRGIVTYAAAKAGIESFTRTLALEVGRKNIRVNCIRPGIINTPMSEAVMDRLGDSVKTTIGLGRYGNPTEISKTALFLASNRTASYMTGECITIDGGMY